MILGSIGKIYGLDRLDCGFWPGGGGGCMDGWMYGCTDVQMDGWTYGNSSLCSIGHWPFGAAAPKTSKTLNCLFLGSG